MHGTPVAYFHRAPEFLLAADAVHFPAAMGPATILLRHSGGAGEAYASKRDGNSTCEVLRCFIRGASKNRSYRSRITRRQRTRHDRSHRIVSLSPCFDSDWPLSRPNDATNLHESLHRRPKHQSVSSKLTPQRITGENQHESVGIWDESTGYSGGRQLTTQPRAGSCDRSIQPGVAVWTTMLRIDKRRKCSSPNRRSSSLGNS